MLSITKLVEGMSEAEIYLNKALTTAPKNRELSFEVKRDLERVLNQKINISSRQSACVYQSHYDFIH
jgi:hypothetical protein